MFSSQPPATKYALLSFPTPQILLVTLNRPEALNCINTAGHWELQQVWDWLDREPGLRVGIITGTGRAFCAGQDLKEWNRNKTAMTAESTPPPGGFAGLSRRRAFGKPVIAAVNGLCLGGGMELVVNVTLVVAARGAQFGLPEVRRGVVAFAGALPRLGRTVGRQRAVEMAVTGRTVGADEGRAWGFVNRVVDDGDVVAAALEMAQDVCKGSPDAVAVTLAGVELAWEPAGGVEDASDRLSQRWAAEVLGRENYTEGLAAFAEKRDPVWVVARSSSKL